MRSVHGRCRVERPHDRRHRGGSRLHAHVRAREPADRFHERHRDGRQEEGRIFLTCAMRRPDSSPSLLRIVTAGSVDDGKSTLLARLLVGARAIFDDRLDAVRKTSIRKGDKEPNLALLLDGLKAEREQGITIDVAYRYLKTPRRTFILADCPVHKQTTRNMVTGAAPAGGG